MEVMGGIKSDPKVSYSESEGEKLASDHLALDLQYYSSAITNF